jgi:hypothetical protein
VSAAHLDYETLADLAEGILDSAEAAAAAAHLTDCATCQEREVELAEVSRVLAEVPAPSVPPELVSRIDAALAAVAAEAPASTQSGRWRRSYMFVAAAAAVAVVAVGGGVTMLRPATTSSTAADANGAPAPRAERPARPLGPSGSAETGVAPGSGQGGPGVTAQRSKTPPVTSSGTDYQKSELPVQLAAADPSLGRQKVGASAIGASGPLSQRLRECLARIGSGRVPLLIDLARYEGAPATVIVFSGKKKDLDVWITGPGCGEGASDVIEHTEVARAG